jgi:hypothetical protein
LRPTGFKETLTTWSDSTVVLTAQKVIIATKHFGIGSPALDKGSKFWIRDHTAMAALGGIANLTQAPQDDKRNGETQGTKLGEARLFQGYSELCTLDLFQGSKQREWRASGRWQMFGTWPS